MTAGQPTTAIAIDDLLERVGRLKEEGWRLVQICATPTAAGATDLDYSFDRDGRYANLRLTVPGTPGAPGAPEGAAVPSISGIYWCAFLYENELHDLFGLRIAGIAVDFKGEFYRTAVKFPFACAAPEGGSGGVGPAAGAVGPGAGEAN